MFMRTAAERLPVPYDAGERRRTGAAPSAERSRDVTHRPTAQGGRRPAGTGWPPPARTKNGRRRLGLRGRPAAEGLRTMEQRLHGTALARPGPVRVTQGMLANQRPIFLCEPSYAGRTESITGMATGRQPMSEMITRASQPGGYGYVLLHREGC